jgi:hypothetical protein
MVRCWLDAEFGGIKGIREKLTFRPAIPQAYQCKPTPLQMLEQGIGQQFSPKTTNGYSYHPGGMGKSSHWFVAGALGLEPSYKCGGVSKPC